MALDNNATLTSLDLSFNNIGAEGARSLAAALDNNATLMSLDLHYNNIGAQGARSLAAALDNNATLTTLYLGLNNIGAQGARSLAAALDTNRVLQHLDLAGNNNMIVRSQGRLVGCLASAVARRVELWDDELVLSPALAARAGVLAFGDELLDLVPPPSIAALRQDLQRLADVANKARAAPGARARAARARSYAREFAAVVA